MAVPGHSNRTTKEIEVKKRKRRSVKDKYEGVIMVGLKMREKKLNTRCRDSKDMLVKEKKTNSTFDLETQIL